jgi:hypothetical protein
MNIRDLGSRDIVASVPKNATGVYYLGSLNNGEFILKYIGRSDTRLLNRLLDHAKKGCYTKFSFELTETIFHAYRIECREWHNDIQLDNKVHPRAPKNLPYECPYCKKNKVRCLKWPKKKKGTN